MCFAGQGQSRPNPTTNGHSADLRRGGRIHQRGDDRGGQIGHPTIRRGPPAPRTAPISAPRRDGSDKEPGKEPPKNLGTCSSPGSSPSSSVPPAQTRIRNRRTRAAHTAPPAGYHAACGRPLHADDPSCSAAHDASRQPRPTERRCPRRRWHCRSRHQRRGGIPLHCWRGSTRTLVLHRNASCGRRTRQIRRTAEPNNGNGNGNGGKHADRQPETPTGNPSHSRARKASGPGQAGAERCVRRQRIVIGLPYRAREWPDRVTTTPTNPSTNR